MHTPPRESFCKAIVQGSFICLGDANFKMPILLESKRYDVTRNCYSALLRLRELGETKVWIDAICIDQTNNEEKCSQIPLMNYIYPAAKEVIVWLGHVEEERQLNSQETDSLAISLLEELSVGEVRTFEQFLEIAQRGEKAKASLGGIEDDFWAPLVLATLDTPRVGSIHKRHICFGLSYF